MSAQSYDTFVLAFSDPVLDSQHSERARVDVNNSLEIFDDTHVRTLSINNGGGEIEGLLYVPTLPPDDPCVNASAQYVPSNVTRLSNLPATDFLYVAIAPWISAPCTLSYLAAAQGVTAFMFYHPDNGTGTPPVSDPSWDLGDGGQWKSRNKFPVYAIPGFEGAIIVQGLAQYNGNSMNPLIENILAYEQFDPSDYVRLYTKFATDGSSDLPSLWAFLLIVLGIVLLLIGATSLSMHCFQRRYRHALQRRVTNGEVDLETLGIKRSTPVPQEEIDKLPTYIYIPTNTSPNERTSDPLNQPHPQPTSFPVSPIKTFYSQSSCTICLEDFIPNETRVRSLPCHHIYHPQCIDLHFSRSSRCPVCMAQVLPRKNEPITNAMVRAERRYRERLRRERGGNYGHWTMDLRRQFERGRRVFGAPVLNIAGGSNNGPTRNQIEMNAVGSGGGRAVSSPVPNGAAAEISGAEDGETSTQPPTDADLRSEWVRRRLSRLHPTRTLEDEEAERWANMPSWRRALGTIFPGFR